MIILTAHTKGGVGKTILSVNLAGLFARDGADLLLVDADRQGTAAAWCELRKQSHPERPAIPCAVLGGKLHQSIPELESRYELILVDAGGYDSVELRSALLVADLHLLPLPPATYALWALGDLEPLRDQASLTNKHLRTLAVINRAQRHYRVHDADDARRHLTDRGIELTETIVYDRRAWRRSENEGLIVPELRRGDAAATSELASLYEEILDAVSE